MPLALIRYLQILGGIAQAVLVERFLHSWHATCPREIPIDFLFSELKRFALTFGDPTARTHTPPLKKNFTGRLLKH